MLALLSTLPGGVSFASSLPVLDGQFDVAYLEHGFSVDYAGFVQGARATLHTIDDAGVDPTYIWLAWVIDLDFNDNSYGNNRHGTWPAGHGFEDLAESDLQRLKLVNACGELSVDATMDVLDGPPPGTGAPYPTPSGYDTSMDSSESVKNFINGGDWSLFAYDTSIASNLNDFGYCQNGNDCSVGGTDLYLDSPPFLDEPNYVPASPYDDWEYRHIYELRIERSVFVTAACPQGGIAGTGTDPVELHASPSKPGVSPVQLFRISASIGDTVWLDLDRDGIQDVTEPGIANVTLALYTDPNGDGDFSDGSLLATTTTDSSGRYLFSDLGTGTYLVTVTDDNGVLAGFSLTVGGSDPFGPIVLDVGESFRDADFGYVPTDATTGVVGDFVWSDADNDGIQDPGEPGIGGVTLDLMTDLDGDGLFDEVVATTTTDADGSYLFTAVDPGEYTVRVTDTGGVLAGYTLTVGPQSESNPSAPFLVNAGDIYVKADFGYFQAGLGTIGNQVWLDSDDDGTFDAGEQGLGNVTLVLIEDSDEDGIWDLGELVVASTTTLADGTYQFSGLRLDDGGGDGDADYLVAVTDVNDVLRQFIEVVGPAPGSDGNSQSQPYPAAVALGSENNPTADFGYWFNEPLGLIGDRIWYDLDGDGVQNPLEPGVFDATVDLYSDKNKNGIIDGQDEVIATVATDLNGLYFFQRQDVDNNGEGYIVVVTDTNGVLASYTQTGDPDAVLDEQGSTILSTGSAVDLSLDFGYQGVGPHSIGDTVFEDLDADGIEDPSDPGIPGVTLKLYRDLDGDGVIDVGEPLIASTVTGVGGFYSFDNLVDDDYIVLLDDEAGLLRGYTQTLGSRIESVTIAGASREDVDFGFVNQQLATIGDFVWEDLDGDGLQDAGEQGIPNVTVRLYDPGADGLPGGGDDLLVASQLTGAGGSYLFTVDAGFYFLEFLVPSGWVLSPRDQGGDDTLDSDPDPATAFTVVTALTAGENDLRWDAGLYRLVAIGDRVWLDLDGDGVQDLGEPGIANVTVELDDGICTLGSDCATVTTDLDGNYLFAGLPPGTYSVQVDESTLPGGPGDLTASPGTSNPFGPVTLTSGELFLLADFGYTNDDPVNALVGDYVWNDLDRDGLQDPSEVGIEGVTLDLIDADTGAVVDSAITRSDGFYLLTAVAAGEYRIQVTDTGGVLAGLSPTPGPQSVGSNESAPFTVDAGDALLDLDFGYAPDACLPRIDFSTDAAGNPLLLGQVIDDEFSAWGVTVTVVDNFPGINQGMIFDSANPTGGDVDLGSPNETCTPPGPGIGVDGEVGQPGENCFPVGNLLIISEDGDSSDPDDNGAGGTITFTFSRDTRIESLDFLDAENLSDSVELFDEFDNSIFFSNLSAPGDNAFELLPVNTAGARRMVITFPASGALSGIDFCLGSIRDKVWLDANGDGLFQLSESGIAGVTVSLLSDPDGVPNNGDEVVIATTVTDAGGDFGFDGLPDGDYILLITDTGGELADLGGTTSPAQAGQLSVSIVDGDDVVGINFGYNAPGSVGDRVWSDADGDGLQDPGEAGIGGVTLDLIGAGPDGMLGTGDDVVLDSETTAADGSYLFSGLPPGEYLVRVTDTGGVLAGYTQTGDPDAILDGEGTATLVLNGSVLTIDFGYQNSALPDVSGNVFEDFDLDGVDDGAGEPGFFGVTIDLVAPGPDGLFGTSDDVAVATTTTDAAGDYLFADVEAGSYRVEVTDRAGILNDYFLTSGLDKIPITVVATDITGIDFGYARSPLLGAIGDTVWFDIDADGIQDASEQGIPGVALDLYEDSDGDGVLSAGDTLLASAVTDGAGQYLFSGLPAGSYLVDVVDATVPGGLVLTGGSDPSVLISLSEGERYDRADFGYASPGATVSIGDTVWADTDLDGLQQPGEVGIAGITVRLLDEFGVEIATTVTDGVGFYVFTGLAPGIYTVEVDTAPLPPDYGTIPTNGPASRTFDLGDGVDLMHADFGFPPADANGSIGDLVWLDADGDGVFDAGESGIEGVTVNLLDDLGNVLATAVTDASGFYDFTGLAAGDYRVDVTDIAGVLAGLNFSPGSPAGSDPTAPITIDCSTQPCTDWDDADFGYAPSQGIGVIGNQVWHDVNGDGFRDPGESGMQGVTVDLWLDVNLNGTIDPGTDNLLRTATTDENGVYEFNGLPVGAYLVTVSDEKMVLTGFTKTSGTAGADDNSQNDPYLVTLTPGSPSNYTADFGYRATVPYTLSGTTFFDIDGNGVINGDDQGVGRVELLLVRDLDGDGVLDPGEPVIGRAPSAPEPSMMGDPPEGFYEFVDLPAGSYIVVAVPDGTFLDGMTQTTQLTTLGVQPVTLPDPLDPLDPPNSTGNDFGFNITPTLAVVSAFRARLEAGSVVLEWETAAEIGTVGFHLERWSAAAGEWVRVSRELLPASIGAPQGGRYRFRDRGAPSAGRASYRLLEVDSLRGERIHGPFSVSPEPERKSRRAAPQSQDFVGRARRPRAGYQRRLEERAAAGATRGRLARGAGPIGPPAETHRLKLITEQEGVHFFAASDLAAVWGLPVGRAKSLIQSGRIALSNRGGEVAWQPAGGGVGIFFFAEAVTSIYTDRNVYWLQPAVGERMGVLDGGSPSPSPVVTGFEDHVDFEQENFAATVVIRDPESDYWFWDFVSAGDPTHGVKPFSLPVQDPEAGTAAELEVRLHGATDAPAAVDHLALVRVNGVEVGELRWDGVEAAEGRFGVPAGVLVAGENLVELEGRLDGGVPYSAFYVDGFGLSYRRLHRAVAGRLRFGGGGAPVVTVAGFGSGQILVFEVSDPVRPRLVAGTTVEAGDGFRVSLVPHGTEAVYQAVEIAAALRPEARIDRPSDLRRLHPGAEYLVIAPSELMEAARELADYRSSRGLEALAVDLEEIYDEFSDGLADPHAIHAFLSHAWRSWRLAPRFVLLAGKGTLDYRDLLGHGDNLVPPLMEATPYGLFAADGRLADLEGSDGVPELALGRVPVLSAAELSAYVRKLERHESGAGGRGVLLLADNADPAAGDFPADSDAVAVGIPPEPGLERIYLSELTVAEARQQLFDLLAEGAERVNYMGHGGLDRLADEGLVRSADAVAFAAGARPPVVIALTCSAGRFELPGFESLAEALTVEPEAGAAAVWSPSGLSVHGEAVRLNQLFVEAVHGEGIGELGEAVRRSLELYAESGGLRYMLYIYNLLGDPALGIH